MTSRKALATGAAVIAATKATQFAADHQALFYTDSGAFVINALGIAFLPYRSWVYSDLIRIFVLPFHSLPLLVAMQTMMGACTAWLLTMALIRYFDVRHSIAIAAALVFAMDPVQIVHEHMLMTETTSILAMACYLVAALEYLRIASVRRPWFSLLVLLSFLGILLSSLRLVYVPVVFACAVLVPLMAFAADRRFLVLTLTVGLSSTLLFHLGYRSINGQLAGREPAYHYMTGYFLLAAASPLVEPDDTDDPRVRQAILAQRQSRISLVPRFRNEQLWDSEGLIARIRAAFSGDDRAADRAAQRLARAAIGRDPIGYLRLGVVSLHDYQKEFSILRDKVSHEIGLAPSEAPNARDVQLIDAAFHSDIAHRGYAMTLSRRYMLSLRGWYAILFGLPFLTGFVFLLRPKNTKALFLIFSWNLMVLASFCLGGTVNYRYLHPFSFTGIVAMAIVFDKWVGSLSQARPKYLTVPSTSGM